MPPSISLYELYEIKKNKDKVKNVAFDEILKRCHVKIKNIAKAGGMNIFYEIPYMLIGFPLYKINLCIDYIIIQLRKNGLLVQQLPEPNKNILYISWSPDDINPQKKKLYLQ